MLKTTLSGKEIDGAATQEPMPPPEPAYRSRHC